LIDSNNLRVYAGEGSSLNLLGGSNNISNSVTSTFSYNLGDNNISYNFFNKNECYSTQQSAVTFLRVYHQNIRGMKFKIDELLGTLCPDFPNVLCLSEHHMNPIELNTIIVNYYNLVAVYCKKILSKGGVCIFVRISVKYTNINLDSFCIDQIIEICTIKLQ
jgi:hypothetical protein